MLFRHIDQTVVRRYQNKSRNRAFACDMYCDTGTEAATDHCYIRMLGVNRVEKSKRGGKNAFLSGMTCAAAVARIVKQIDG